MTIVASGHKAAGMSTDIAKQPEEGPAQDVQAPKPVSRFTRWFRSPLFNVVLVGMISFTQPGIWNALNSMFEYVTWYVSMVRG